ncbi:MAG: prepilin-type N-terminal cleavage/methylation domain-containing protein [Burkholderiales bacterium]|jgi:prepilin-type N-terminal cleavage/methylation domain-containing protein|nr:prepilin-type N-terminal cleavage/methylation domain-containing protein [Burkholderiales bacterium]
MKAHRKLSALKSLTQSGFTLLEMAFVLVIIGLIVGALSIGKDVQRNAEYHKIANKFVYDWKKSYDEYYQRTGVVLGDSQIAPTYMVNGKEAVIGGGSDGRGNVFGAVAGLPENYVNTGLKICHGQGYPKNSVGAGDSDQSNQDLRDLMQQVGIRMPPGRSEGLEDRYVYTDSNGNATELQICFQWNQPSTISGAGNVMVLRGLTPDLARYLDQLIDGKADALEGRFRQQDDRLNTQELSSQRPGREWSANNTYAQDDAVYQTADGRGNNRDEDRVVLLTAQWIMEQ